MTGKFTPAECHYMRRALRLARRGEGRVEPNPMVGCVLVHRGRIIGEGWHRRYGGAHAEVEALRRAGSAARGATAYVTLEPCCHHGKTPPCTDALIFAGVRRVVAATTDPFPTVQGRGIRGLRRAGLRVDSGLLENEARAVLAPYLTLTLRRRPYTILKWAQSIDGKIATRTGDSRWISSPPARRHVHRLRARVDAILVGLRTVLVDDPMLTARDVPIRRTATRVVLDSRLAIPLRAALVRTAEAFPTLILTTRHAQGTRSAKAERLRRAGVEVVGCRARRGRVDLPSALRVLGARRITNLLVEGGGTVFGAFLDAGLADEALVFVSPRLIGGDEAVNACRGSGASGIADCRTQGRPRITRLGDDLLYRIQLLAADRGVATARRAAQTKN